MQKERLKREQSGHCLACKRKLHINNKTPIRKKNPKVHLVKSILNLIPLKFKREREKKNCFIPIHKTKRTRERERARASAV